MSTDENAFGILISYYRVEDDEYGLERREFVDRYELFRSTVRDWIRDAGFARGTRVVDFGHAVYLELADDDAGPSPLRWARSARERLSDHAFESVAVVTHGSRWVDDDEAFFSTEHIGDCSVITLSNPSEPLRRALYADAATHSDEFDSAAESAPKEGWGPGLYLDTEAAEALAMIPKNAPTVLSTCGAGFYRVGK